MEFRLGPAARAAGHRLHVHEQLGSTNSEALELARSGEPGPLWIVTHRQKAGRGRRGNAWVSPEGNLAASLLMPVTGVAPERVATLGFVAGLALVKVLDDIAISHPTPHPEVPKRSDGLEGGLQLERRFLEGAFEAAAGAAAPQDEVESERRTSKTFRLKWPNDVLANGKKIAGILLEAEGRRAVVIGFGVNVVAAPEGLPYPATALAERVPAADARALFEALTGRFVETAEIWNKGNGFLRIRQLWLERAAGIGDPVSVRLPGGTIVGRHDGIDEGGRLRILAPNGKTHTVTAGEVHFGEAATAV